MVSSRTGRHKAVTRAPCAGRRPSRGARWAAAQREAGHRGAVEEGEGLAEAIRVGDGSISQSECEQARELAEEMCEGVVRDLGLRRFCGLGRRGIRGLP